MSGTAFFDSCGGVSSSGVIVTDVGSVVSSSFELVPSEVALAIENVGPGVVFQVDLFVREITPTRSSGNTSGLKRHATVLLQRLC